MATDLKVSRFPGFIPKKVDLQQMNAQALKDLHLTKLLYQQAASLGRVYFIFTNGKKSPNSLTYKNEPSKEVNIPHAKGLNEITVGCIVH